MQNLTLSNIIENFDILNIEDKGYVLNIIKKNYLESKRDLLYQRVKEADNNYSLGNFKKGGLKELLEDLDND